MIHNFWKRHDRKDRIEIGTVERQADQCFGEPVSFAASQERFDLAR
jgi:hypothetical protein